MEGQIEAKGAIIIGGGVGPLAGVKLHEKIINLSRTSGSDQDHIDIIHISRSSKIADRTQYLLGLEKENPGSTMGALVASEAALFKTDKNTKEQPQQQLHLCTGVPCNTFHAPVVWAAFLQELSRAIMPIKPVHMLDSCLSELQMQLQQGAVVGILSTTGTARSGVWREQLERGGFSPLEVDEPVQESVHQAIYDPEWGLKSETPPSRKAVASLKEAAAGLVEQGAEAIILGCTEIPLALDEGRINGMLQIDPVSSLARELIRTAGGEVKESSQLGLTGSKVTVAGQDYGSGISPTPAKI